ncbi:hypothetical protein Tco_0315796 [Tanacetum coccineum]
MSSIKNTSVVHKKIMTPRSGLSEPPNGSKEDITNQCESEQALDVSAGLVPQRQKASDYDNSDPVPPRQNVIPTAEKTDSSQQGLEFLFSPLLEEYYNPTHSQAEENNNDQAPNASSSPLEQVRAKFHHASSNKTTLPHPEMCMLRSTVSMLTDENRRQWADYDGSKKKVMILKTSFEPVARWKRRIIVAHAATNQKGKLIQIIQKKVYLLRESFVWIKASSRAWYDETIKLPVVQRALLKIGNVLLGEDEILFRTSDPPVPISWMSETKTTLQCLQQRRVVALSCKLSTIVVSNVMRTHFKIMASTTTKIRCSADLSRAIVISCNPVQHCREKADILLPFEDRIKFLSEGLVEMLTQLIGGSDK